MKSNIKRFYGMDNCRAFLIICVVFAHFYEIYPLFSNINYAYKLIYSFHMPVLIFITGYFSKFNIKRIIQKHIMLYILFQCIYTIVVDKTIPQQFSTPYWLLWYLFVCIFYSLLLPFYDTEIKVQQAVIVVLAFIAAIVSGYINSIGYYLSLSRFFCFQPWFILGFYAKKYEQQISDIFNNNRKKFLSVGITCCIASAIFLAFSPISAKMMYSSYSYSAIRYSALIRAQIMIVSLVWIVFFFVSATTYLNKYIPCISELGQNTLAIYLGHGLIVKLLYLYVPTICNNIFYLGICAAASIILLGNKSIMPALKDNK